MEEKNVIAVATGNTYDLVTQYSVHAHPAVSPYSSGREFLIPIKKGGTLEYIYKVVTTIECLPEDIEKHKDSLTEQQYLNLFRYTNARNKTYGFSRKNTAYRFFILEKYGDIKQPFIRKNIQVSVFYNLDEIPVVQGETKSFHQEWIIPCNADLYDIDGALRKLKIIDWYQNRMIKNAKVGDLVYIYCTSKHDVNRVKYKGAILAVNKYDNFIDDSEFDLTNTYGYKVEGPCFSIAVFREYEINISYDKLKVHGLKSKLQGPNKVFDSLSSFLHSCDIEQRNIDRFDGTIPDTCLVNFPIEIKENLDDEQELEAFDTKENYINNLNKEYDKIEHSHFEGKDKEAIVKQRVGQGLFRDFLSRRYKKCAISQCLVHSLPLMRASHIKPWKDSSPEEKVDENNGLLLCPNHDQLFDKGYISFDDNGKILISSKLDSVERTYLNVNEDMSIEVNDKICEYLEYHRNKEYKK